MSNMQRPERVYRPRGPILTNSRTYYTHSLPATSSEPTLSSRSFPETHSRAHINTGNIMAETERIMTDPSLRPPGLFHGSLRGDPSTKPSVVPGSKSTKRRAVTDPVSSSYEPPSKKSKSTKSFRHVRQRSILPFFNGMNTKSGKISKSSKSRSHGTDFSIFSSFSGTQYYVNEAGMSEIYRPLDRAVDPRISRPFKYFTRARTYGPGDIRVINVPSPNTPNLAGQLSRVQSQHVSPTEQDTTRTNSDGIPSEPDSGALETQGYRQHERHSSSKPSPVGFWHKSLSSTRRSAIVKFCQTLFILLVAIFIILVLGAGVLSEVEERIPSLAVAVVNFDTEAPSDYYPPIIGSYIQSFCKAQFTQNRHLDFQFPDPFEFGNNPLKVTEAVYNHQYWAAVVINPNATRQLYDAITHGNPSYDPRDIATIIYNESRDVQVYEAYVTPMLDRLALDLTTAFSTYWSHNVLSTQSFNESILATTPQALSPGINFSFLNLRPFTPPTAISTTSVSLIYLVIISFYSCTFFMHTHILFVLRHPSLKFSHLVAYRWCATVVAYFFFALIYSLTNLLMQVPLSSSPPSGQNTFPTSSSISSASPHGSLITFLVYFALNFLGTVSLGLASENMAMFLSLVSALPYSLLFLLFWIVSNASTSFYSLELANGFYKFGYVWPMHQMVEGTKTLVLGTKSNLVANFAILAGWVALGSVLFPMACWLMRWKGIRSTRRSSRPVSDGTVDLSDDASSLRDGAMV